jgi:hypothetical protein
MAPLGWQKFWKVSALVHLLYNASTGSTFENLCPWVFATHGQRQSAHGLETLFGLLLEGLQGVLLLAAAGLLLHI